MVGNPYEELKAISDAVYAGERTAWGQDVLALLGRNGIRPRGDDGTLHKVTFSVAKEPDMDTLVVGLRYQKRDGSFTEDTFVFQPGKEIVKCYGTKIERLLPEYKGTHKAPPTNPIVLHCLGPDNHKYELTAGDLADTKRKYPQGQMPCPVCGRPIPLQPLLRKVE